MLTEAGNIQRNDLLIERNERGTILRRIPVKNVKPGACSRTKIHVNDTMCYDNVSPVEIHVDVN